MAGILRIHWPAVYDNGAVHHILHLGQDGARSHNGNYGHLVVPNRADSASGIGYQPPYLPQDEEPLHRRYYHGDHRLHYDRHKHPYGLISHTAC